MDYKIIKVPANLKCGGQGAFGTYYKVSKGVGVKTVYDREFTSLKKAKQSWELKAARNELNNLKEVYKKTKMTPKGYDVVILKIKYRSKTIYKVGYSMQHLVGKIVEYSDVKNSHSLWDRAKVKFANKGYTQVDMHTHNAIVVKQRGKRPKVLFIDAGGIVKVGDESSGCAWRE